MDLQTRKLELIKAFLEVQSEDIILRLEEILGKKQGDNKIEKFDPMSVEELNERIDQSIDDSRKGKLTEGGVFITEIEGWS